jgi:hypothetical protein
MSSIKIVEQQMESVVAVKNVQNNIGAKMQIKYLLTTAHIIKRIKNTSKGI